MKAAREGAKLDRLKASGLSSAITDRANASVFYWQGISDCAGAKGAGPFCLRQAESARDEAKLTRAITSRVRHGSRRNRCVRRGFVLEIRTGRTVSASPNLQSGNASRSRRFRAFSRRGIRGLPSAAPIVRALIARVVCVCFRPRACVLSMSSLSSSRDSPFASPFCSLFAGLRAFRHATRQERTRARSALIGHRFDRPRAHHARRLCMLQIQIWR